MDEESKNTTHDHAPQSLHRIRNVLGVYNVLCRHSNIAIIFISYEDLALDSMNMVLYGVLADIAM